MVFGLDWDHGHGLNFNEHIGMGETADLNRRVDRANAPEEFVVCSREVSESAEIREVGTRLNNVVQLRARLLEKELDFLEDMDALTVHVSG